MKTLKTILIITAVAAGFTTQDALAQRGGGPGGGQGRQSQLDRALTFDANNDGKLTKDELPERMQGILTRADANKDGVATKEELTKVFAAQQGGGERGGRRGGGFGGGGGQRGGGGGFGGGGPGGGRGPGGPGGFMRMFPVMAALDADEDGEISAKEIENAVAALKALDKDKNGKLTEDELRPNFGGRGGFGGPGGGRGPGGGGGDRDRGGSRRPQRPQ